MKGDNYSGFVIYDQKGANFSKNETQLFAEEIQRILMTRRGERINNPDFGSDVQKFIFMPQLSIDDLLAEIKNSIERCEPRLKVNSCTLSSATQDDVVNIDLNVTILNPDGTETGMELGVSI